MPIEVNCSGCQRTFRVPDKVAGKKIKCPKCANILQVPAPAPSTPNANAWHVKTADGQEYGPVSKKDLDDWVTEGRLDADCQVLQVGAPQWQWASDVYPQLDAPSPAPAPASPNITASPSGSSNVHTFDFAAAGTSKSSSSSSGPFDFANSNSGVAARLSGKSSVSRSKGRTTRGQTRAKSGAVTAVAIVNFILGTLQLLCGLLLAIGGGVVASFIKSTVAELPDQDAQQGAALAGILGGLIIIFGIAFLLFGLFVIIAGVGVMQRAQWGRIMTLILGGVAGIFAVLNLLSIFAGNFGGIVPVLLDGGYCGMVFAILLNKQHAAEFR
jgi:hypothetical protein